MLQDAILSPIADGLPLVLATVAGVITQHPAASDREDHSTTNLCQTSQQSIGLPTVVLHQDSRNQRLSSAAISCHDEMLQIAMHITNV
jgi:hypothetical protein